MLGFFSLFKDNQNYVKKEEVYLVSIPSGLPEKEIKERYAKIAREFADHCDANKVYLNYGKDEFIEYDYSIQL